MGLKNAMIRKMSVIEQMVVNKGVVRTRYILKQYVLFDKVK